MLTLIFAVSCKWFVTEQMIRDAKDRDNDGFMASQVGGPDCNDADPQIHPRAVEICGDEVDNNCDLKVDNFGIGNIIWYSDIDGDGYGVEATTREACPDELLGTDWAPRAGDCDDSNSLIHPAADEICGDSLDNDCNGEIDETFAGLWTDADQDGFGDSNAPVPCEQQVFPVSNDLDCDDTRPNVYPGALETCDGIDNDCNQISDDLVEIATVDGTTNVGSVTTAFATAQKTVQFCAGEHTTGLVRLGQGDDLTVLGVGRDATTLRSTSGSGIFLVQDGALTISDLTLDGASDQETYAIEAFDADRIFLLNSRFEGNDRALYITGPGGDILIENTDLVDNTGLAMLLVDAGYIPIVGGRITANAIGIWYRETEIDAMGVDWGGVDLADVAWLDGGSYQYQGVQDVYCDGDAGCTP